MKYIEFHYFFMYKFEPKKVVYYVQRFSIRHRAGYYSCNI